MYVSSHAHTHSHTHLHTLTRTHTLIYTPTHTHTHLLNEVGHTPLPLNIYRRIYALSLFHTHTHTLSLSHTHTHTHTHTHAHTDTHTHTHFLSLYLSLTHAHAHTQVADKSVRPARRLETLVEKLARCPPLLDQVRVQTCIIITSIIFIVIFIMLQTSPKRTIKTTHSIFAYACTSMYTIIHCR